jgi:molybdopterin molybdotransferase
MHTDIQMTREPIPGCLPAQPADGAGAWVEFRGVVRAAEDGLPISALEYQAYSPMAEREIRRILLDLANSHSCLAARVLHRVGVVPAGDTAIYVGIAGRHRAEAFALLAGFMDRLKQDVPIWKVRALPAPAPNAPAPSATPAAHSADEVIAHVRRACQPLPAEPVPLNQALGRVLREPVLAPTDQPPFDRSAVDGYAVNLGDPSGSFRIVDGIRAGEWRQRALAPAEAVRVATGAALPAPNLRVFRKEDVRADGDTVYVLEREDEANIRFRGEDAPAGTVLARPGTLLRHGTLALLASVGVVLPSVTRLPRVFHLATGDEIVPPGSNPAPGQVRDSNSTLVRAFLLAWGVVPVQQRVPEDAAAMRRALEVAAGADLLLISGGASVGEHDFTRTALVEAGFTILVSKTNARPGKPLILARRGSTLAFGLPGNPLAHFVCLNLYVRPALEAWAGLDAPAGFQTGFLAEDLAPDASSRETFWPASHAAASGRNILTPLSWKSSGDLTALATANALIRVVPGAERFARGCPVEFLPTGRVL